MNGMSFSKRDSRWANAALVVSLSPTDVANDVAAMEGGGAGGGGEEGGGPLRGVRWQSAMERRAAEMGGGDLGEARRLFLFALFWTNCTWSITYCMQTLGAGGGGHAFATVLEYIFTG